MASNIEATPDIGAERWCSNNPRSYRIKWKPAIDTYTRWFNMHTIRHISLAYPTARKWYANQTKPIYLQEAQPDIPSSITFPRQQVLDYFNTRYFTCSVTWLIAFAIMEGFDRIELHGFELKRDRQYDFERPCFFYWIEEARKRGIDVYLPPDVEITPPGDPTGYDGPLYGFEPHNDIYARTF
jgi:hypothetical protein